MRSRRLKKVVHVAGEGILKSSGYSQQIFMEVAALKRLGYDVYVVAFCHIKYFRDMACIRAIRQKFGKRDIVIYLVPCFFSGRILTEFLYYPIIWLVISYFVLVKRARLIHVHSYGYGFALVFFRLLGLIRLFVDVHGVVSEERIYRRIFKSNSIADRYTNLKEGVTFEVADMIFCVSQGMIRYYMTKHSLPMDCFALTRSSFDPDIFKEFSWDLKKKAKELLKVKGKKVLLYMGHKKAWQLTDDVINMYVELKGQIDNLLIIFLTDDVEGVKKSLESFQVSESDYIVKYVSHKDVPLYSYAADAAVILRDDSIVNRASSPVKFSEYLASGIFVLVNSFVGDLSSFVKKFGIGCVVDKQPITETVTLLRTLFEDEEKQMQIAERCRRVAENAFSVEKTIEVFQEYYQNKGLGKR